MKLYLSADIEGTAGIDSWDETELGEYKYAYFAEQMTREVKAACTAAQKSGVDVTVKDAHDSARNLHIEQLPENTSVIRGWIKDPLCMMGGLDRDKFDCAAFTGYHSDAMSVGNPLSHTMTRRVQSVKINGEYASEFVINAYIAGFYGVPVIFLSGDKALCEKAKLLVPGIKTVAAKEGYGGAVIADNPAKVCREIEQTMTEALSFVSTPEGKAACTVKMPPHFKIEIEYKEWIEAYKYSFFPGAVYTDAKTVVFESDSYYDMMIFMHFCL